MQINAQRVKMANIKVAVRVRPLSRKEECGGGRHVVGVGAQEKTITITDIKVPSPGEGGADHRERVRHFAFDYTYHSEDRGPWDEKESKTKNKNPKKVRKKDAKEGQPPPIPRIQPPSAATEENIESPSLENLEVPDEAEAEVKSNDSDQELLYRELGEEMEAAAMSGYNVCILAYGQSGSGKTYTVLGHKDAPGLAPRICQGLLTRLQRRYEPDDLCADDFSLTLSLIEIYNERVRDLLTDSEPARPLRVREHPHTGPYVDGVTRHAITDTSIAWSLLERGRASRSVAPTASHAHSSRSHALLTLDITQPAAHTRSTLTLVDLAGSERAGEDGDKTRLTEGASINRSLVTLGNVISALAERGGALGSTRASPMGSSLSLNTTVASYPSYAHSNSSAHFGAQLAAESVPCDLSRRARLPFIPYRDSVLTWLLKDSLGGNAKTLMIATISPSSTSYNESVATLRYATRARCIVNVPVVNLDSGAATIRSLQREVAALKKLLCKASPSVMQSLGTRGTALLDFLSKATTTDLTRDWVERLHQDKEEKEVKRLRRRSAPPGGGGYTATKISLNRSTSSLTSTEDVQSSLGPRDIIVESESPYLLNTLEDAHASSIIIYHIQNGASVVGSGENADLHLSSAEVATSHCTLTHARGAVTLRCLPGCELTVNGETVTEGGAKRLFDGDLITIGTRHFSFHAPTRTRPRSKSCPRRQVRVDSGTEPAEWDDEASTQDSRRQQHHKATQCDQPAAYRKNGCASHSGICVRVVDKGMGQSQSQSEESFNVEEPNYEYPGEEESWPFGEPGFDNAQKVVDAFSQKDVTQKSLHSTWSDVRKVSGESMSEYETMSGTTIKAPPLAERRSPLGASQSEGNISQRGPDLTDVEDESGTKSHYCLHESYFFGSNNSIDSSISQPSCASLDSRLTHVSGSSNTYQSKVVPRNFFLDLNKGGRGCASATSTPLTSPQSPSETRRHWDSSIWPEVERGLRRNQSVPDIRSTKPLDEKRQLRKGSLQSPKLQSLATEDREKRQKIIEAVTQRLYPGSGPGFRRYSKKHPEKAQAVGERECSCRKKMSKSDPSTPVFKGSDVGTPRQTKRFSVGAPVSPRAQWDTSLASQVSSLKGFSGSRPVYDDTESDRYFADHQQEFIFPTVPQKIKKSTSKEDLKSSLSPPERMSNMSELDNSVSESQKRNLSLSDRNVECKLSSGYLVKDSTEKQERTKYSDSNVRAEKEKFVKSSSPPENRLQRQSAHSEPDLLSDVVGAAGGGRDKGEVEVKEEGRERRKIPLTPGLFQLQRALASLNDPERFSDDSLELPTLDADSLSPSVSRLSPPVMDEEEMSLGDISKDSLEDVSGSHLMHHGQTEMPCRGANINLPYHLKNAPPVKEGFSRSQRPPPLKDKKDSFIQAFFQSASITERVDSLEIEEEFPSFSDDSSDAAVPDSGKSSSFNSYNSSNVASSSSALTPKMTAVSVPSSNTLTLPKVSRRSARERAEKRILDSTSSEESDGDSRRRPRFRKRRVKRSSLPLISMDTLEPETKSDSGEYLSLQYSTPEKDRLSSEKDVTIKPSKTVRLQPEGEWADENISLYGNVNYDTFTSLKRAKLRSFQVRYGKEIPEPPVPSERESPLRDFNPSECHVMQQPDAGQGDALSSNTRQEDIGALEDVDTQNILKESAKRLLQAVNKDGVMSEASQDAVADLLKASSQRLASYTLSMADNASPTGLTRSSSVTTQDEDYDTALGEETWQESSNESQSSSKQYPSQDLVVEGSTAKSISPVGKQRSDEMPENISEKASFSDLIKTRSGQDVSYDMNVETEDYAASTGTASDGCSTEGSWEEMDTDNYQKIQDSSISKKHVQVISAEFTPRTARRLLYTIVECSESSRSESVPSESDVIPSDWQDTLSETGEEFGSEHVTDEVSENLMSSSDETMLDTVRQNQEDPQDSLSCVSDDILGDSRSSIVDDPMTTSSQDLARNMSGSLEFLSNLPMSPDIFEREEQTDSPGDRSTYKMQIRGQRRNERFSTSSASKENSAATSQVTSDDEQSVFASESQQNKDSIPDYIPSLDLSTVNMCQQSPAKQKPSSRSNSEGNASDNKEEPGNALSSHESTVPSKFSERGNASFDSTKSSRPIAVLENISHDTSHLESHLTGEKSGDSSVQSFSPTVCISGRTTDSKTCSQEPLHSSQTSEISCEEVGDTKSNDPINSKVNLSKTAMAVDGVTQERTLQCVSLEAPQELISTRALKDASATAVSSLAGEITSSSENASRMQSATPFISQSSLAYEYPVQELTPVAPQNSVTNEAVVQRVMPLTPQNSRADGAATQEVIPISTQVSLADVTLIQTAASVTPQNSVTQINADQVPPVTTQNSVQDLTLVKSQSSLDDGITSQNGTAITSQSQSAPRTSVETDSNVVPPVSLVDRAAMQRIASSLIEGSATVTPQSSVAEETADHQISPMIAQGSSVEGTTGRSGIPLTPQNSLADSMVPQGIIPLTPQNLVADTTVIQKITPVIPQNLLTEDISNQTDSVVTPERPQTEEAAMQRITPVMLQSSLLHRVRGTVPVTPQNSLADETVTRGTIPVLSQDSIPEEITSHTGIPLTPQYSQVDSVDQRITSLTPQNSLADASVIQGIIPPTSQILQAEETVNQLITPLTPQNSLAGASTDLSDITVTLQNTLGSETVIHRIPLTPQNSLADVAAIQRTPLTPQNSLADMGVVQRTPLTPQNFLADMVVIQRTPVTPQNSLADTTATQRIPVTPQNSLADATVIQKTPVTPQNSLADVTVIQRTPVTPQNSLADATVIQRTPVTPQNSLADATIIQRTPVTPQNSLADVTVVQRTLLTPQNSLADAAYIQRTPITPQNSLVDVAVSQRLAPVTPQNSFADGIISESAYPLDVAVTQRITPQIVQRIMADETLGEALNTFMPLDTSTNQTAIQSVRSLPSQDSVSEGSVIQRASLHLSSEENINQSSAPSSFQNLLAKEIPVQNTLSQARQTLTEGITTHTVTPQLPLDSLVEGVNTQSITPLTPQNSFAEGHTDQKIASLTPQDLNVEGCLKQINSQVPQHVVPEEKTVPTAPFSPENSLAGRSISENLAPQTTQHLFLEGSTVQKETPTPQHSLTEVAPSQKMPPPTPQNSLAEGNVVSVPPPLQCLMETSATQRNILSSQLPSTAGESIADSQIAPQVSAATDAGLSHIVTSLKSSTDAGVLQVPTKDRSPASQSSHPATSISELATRDDESIADTAVLPSVTPQESANELPSQSSLSFINLSSQTSSSSTGNFASLRTPTVPLQNPLVASATPVPITISSQIPSQVDVTSLSQTSLTSSPLLTNASQLSSSQNTSGILPTSFSGESTLSQMPSAVPHQVPDSLVLSPQASLDRTPHAMPSQIPVQVSAVSPDINQISEGSLSSSNILTSSTGRDPSTDPHRPHTISFQNEQPILSQKSQETTNITTAVAASLKGLGNNTQEPNLTPELQCSNPTLSIPQATHENYPTDNVSLDTKSENMDSNTVIDKACLPTKRELQYHSDNLHDYSEFQSKEVVSKDTNKDSKIANVQADSFGKSRPTIVGQENYPTNQKKQHFNVNDSKEDSKDVLLAMHDTLQEEKTKIPEVSVTECQKEDLKENPDNNGRFLGDGLSGDDSEEVSVAEDALLACQTQAETTYKAVEKGNGNNTAWQDSNTTSISQQHSDIVVIEAQDTEILREKKTPDVSSLVRETSNQTSAVSRPSFGEDSRINLPDIAFNKYTSNQDSPCLSLKVPTKDQLSPSGMIQSQQEKERQELDESVLRNTESLIKPGTLKLGMEKDAPLPKRQTSKEHSSRPLSPVLPTGSPFHQQSIPAGRKTESGYNRIVRQISNLEDNPSVEESSGSFTGRLQVSESKIQEYAGQKASKPSSDSDEDIKSQSGKHMFSNTQSSSYPAKTKREIFSRKSSMRESKKADTASDAIKVGDIGKSTSSDESTKKNLIPRDQSQNSSQISDSHGTKVKTGDTAQSLIQAHSKEPARQDFQRGSKNNEEELLKDIKNTRSHELPIPANSTSIINQENELDETSREANIEVTVSDYCEPTDFQNNLSVSQITDDDIEMRLSQLSPRSKAREKKRIEKLTSASWQGTFVMEHEHTEDDWGGSDESITFIFMTPGEEGKSAAGESTKPDNYGTSSCSNYRSSSDLSHVGLTLGIPGNAQYVHSYDLYKANCRRLIRTTSLDSISCALHKLRAAKLKTELQRTCSLEDMTQEMAAILERGRLFSSADLGEISDAEAVMMDEHKTKLLYQDNNSHITSDESKEMGGSQRTSNSSSVTLKTQDSNQSSVEDDVFVRTPSPAITYGQASWGEWKNMILGHTSPTRSIRRMSGETSKSSPQLHRRISSENLNKKSVSWTDLQGCGALEINVNEMDKVKEMGIKPAHHVKSIMKKPSLAPIAPTPPPPITPPPSPPKPMSKDNLIMSAHKPKSPSASDDDIPLPRSNLKEMFSLQLPPHIKDRAFRAEYSASESQQTSLSYGSPPIRDKRFTNERPLRTTGQPWYSDEPSSLPTGSSLSQYSYGSTNTQNTVPGITYEDHRISDARKSSMDYKRNKNEYSSYDAGKLGPYSCRNPGRYSSSSHYSASDSYANISSDTSSQGSSPISDSTTFEALDSDNIQNNSASKEMPSFLRRGLHGPSALATSTPTDTELPIPSPVGVASAPTTPGDPSRSNQNYNIPRYRSEGDLTRRSGEGLPSTWATLSRVMQEAGTILKTLSETSLELHHQMASPDQRGSLPPVMEENSSSFYLSDPKNVSSVAVQTIKSHKAKMNTRSTIAQTSFESSSDTENFDSYSRTSYMSSKTLSHKSTYKRYETNSTGSREIPVLRELNRLRKERERMNDAMNRYETSMSHMPSRKSRGIHISSSSELDSPISSLMTSLQNVAHGTSHQDKEHISGTYSHHNLSATSQRYLDMYRRRLQDSCHQLEERLRLSAKKRKLRSRMLSNSHSSHFHTDPAKKALHASLDFAKNPFCGRPESSTSPSYLSTASLPTIGPPQSPAHSRRDMSPCCCISPTHQSRSTHLCSPIGTCSAHTHWASCHGSPAPDLSYTPHCMTARVRKSSQQCRDQLFNLRKQLVSTSGLASSSSSLGDSSPPGRGNSHRLRGLGSIFDSPYQRDQAASLSSLPVSSSSHRTWKRSNLTGSAISVASESEADRVRWPRHRIDSDSDSGAGWSSSGTSLRHTYR